MKRSSVLLLSSLFLFSACKRTKIYYVHIVKVNNEQHTDTIKASSDSIAYARGYKYFKVGELLEKDIKDSVQNCTPGTYKSFTVTDAKGRLISYNLSDKAKAELEEKARFIISGSATVSEDDE